LWRAKYFRHNLSKMEMITEIHVDWQNIVLFELLKSHLLNCLLINRRHVANNNGGGVKSIVDIRGQVRMRGKVGLNLSLIHMHPFPQYHPTFFLFSPLQLNSQTCLLGRKNIEGLFVPFPPPPSCVCALSFVHCHRIFC